MPVVRYFFFVGGVLLALLFMLDAYLPKLPAADGDYAGVDKSIIRIHSDRKWPERVVFDTRLPTEVRPQIVSMAASTAASKMVADASPTASTREAFAQLSSEPKQAQLSAATKPEQSAAIKPKPQPKRKIAKRRAAPPMVLVAQQPQFGFFANNTW